MLTHLLSLSEAGPQQRQEDPGDGHVVSWLSDARVFSTGKDRHAPGDVPHWHLVTLQDKNNTSKGVKLAFILCQQLAVG